MGNEFFRGDFIGRKNTFILLQTLSILLYFSLFHVGEKENLGFFVLQYSLLVSLYGGSFASLPAFVAETFGSRFAGGIHARILSFWSVAVLASAGLAMLRQHQISIGVDPYEAGSTTYDIITALVCIGFISNFFIKPLQYGTSSSNKTIHVSLDTSIKPSAALYQPETTPPRWLSLLALWSLAIIPLAWGVLGTIRQASEFPVTIKIAITLLPMFLGAFVCIGCHYLDQSRFRVRGISGDYFSSVAILFSLLASLLATEIWEKITRADSLLHDEVSALHAAVTLSKALNNKDQRVAQASKDYWASVIESERTLTRTPSDKSDEALDRLYAVAADTGFFNGNDSTNSEFLDAVDTVRSSRLERLDVMSQKMSVGKLISLMLLGLLTQVAIALGLSGKDRALNTSVMLFSVAFALAVAILELLDGSYTLAGTLPASLLSRASDITTAIR